MVDSHSLITFDNSFVEVKTRVEDPSITTDSIDAFDVWGFIDTASGTVFSQEPVAKTADKKWEYANKQYWLPNHHYYFYAVAPAHALAHPTVERENTAIKVTTDMDDKGLGTIEFTNENGTLDLLYAEKVVETMTTNDPGTVQLQFMHLLSKVQFTFKNAFYNDNTTLKVKNLKIVNAPKKGSVTVKGENRTEYTWTIVQGDATTLDFGNVNGGAAFNVREFKESDFARLTIPADATRSYTIEFDLYLYYGDQLAGEGHKSVSLEGQTFAIGKNYNIVAEITPDNFADNPLKPIVFETITVDTWEDGVIDGKVDFTDENGNGGNQGGNQEPTQPVALATPDVTATVDENVVTLTWEAIDGAAEYTVQVDDDVVETVNAPIYTFNGDYEVEYTFTVKAIAADKAKNTDSEAAVVKATTEAKPAAPAGSAITVEEFLALTEIVPEEPTAEELAAAKMYTLTGTITAVANEKYGNFDLTDETGTVLIYGLLSPDGTTNQYWATSGAQLGDEITVKTIRTEYKGSPQGKNAWYVSHKTPGTIAFWSFDKTSVSFAAAAADNTINVAIYNTTAAVETTSDNGQFSASYDNGILTVSARENTSSEEITGNITVTCGTLIQVISVSQLGASSGNQTTVEATISFADKANRTEYSTTKQVWVQNGITVTNEKGASTTNVGDYANPARFYKSSTMTVEAPGPILSIAVNVSSIESKYVTHWGTAENGIVTIKLDGTSKTYTVDSFSAQARANSFTVTYLSE